MRINTISDIKNLHGKKVLLRVDFNAPIKNGKVVDNFKIKKSLATIKYLLHNGASVLIVSHLGRPKGAQTKFSLKPVCKELEKFLNRKIDFFSVKDFNKIKKSDSRLAILENIRFLKGEEENSAVLAKSLSELADIFVLDGFAVAHRDAASVSGVAKYLPAFAGLLLQTEIEGLEKIMAKPKKPLVVVLGGAKMETKIPVLKNLLKKADYILLGGGMVNTYLWAKGFKVGDSLVDKNYKKEALKYCSKKKIILPVDVITGEAGGKKAQAIDLDKKFAIKNKNIGIYDIGPKTIKLFSTYIKKAQTLVWNGAVGYFEQHPYQYGTYSVARLFAARSTGKAFGVCGGGETAEVLQKLGLTNDIDLVSTGGGAMLEYLAGKKLPGIEAIAKKNKKFKLF